MRICIGQTKPIKGDFQQNLAVHMEYIKSAVRNNGDLILFPELSLTGYEPGLARKLATTSKDPRLHELQKLSDQHTITIGVGLPIIENNQIFIGMAIIQPHKEKVIYTKQYLYPTEIDVFTPGHNPMVINFDNENVIAPAICYELSIEDHAKNAYQNHATIYMASVLNSVNGVDNDLRKLSEIAARYKMTAFMANYVGESGGYECAGKSSIWNDQGKLIAQLDDQTEGVLMYDTKTKEVAIEKINCR